MVETSVREHWFDINGAAMHCLDAGVGSPTLLLIHEMGGSLHSWDRLVPLLPMGCRVVRYDVRGHGLSEKVRGTLAIQALVDDANVLLDRLGVDGNVVTVGCAVGGAVALSYAARHPGRCAAVVALAPSTVIPPERKEAALRRADAVEREGVRPTLDDALSRSYPERLRQDAATFERTRAQRLGADPSGFAAMMRMLAGLDIADDLASLRCPVSVVAGTYDQDRPPELLKSVAAGIPGARFTSIESAHFMAIQTPDLVAAEIGLVCRALQPGWPDRRRGGASGRSCAR